MFYYTTGSGDDIPDTKGPDTLDGNSDCMRDLGPSLHQPSRIDKLHYHKAVIVNFAREFNYRCTKEREGTNHT
jgi:hypothetical protein